MNKVGIVRNMDRLGRVVVPKELRKLYGLEEDTPIEILAEGEQIILRKYRPACAICGSAGSLHACGGIRLCRDCLDRFR